MSKKKNIYVIGNILGAYRSQAVLSILVCSNKYNLNFNNFSFFGISNKNLLNLIKGVDILFASTARLYFLIRSDIVFVLAMNNNKYIQILFAKLLGKKIIADFYISYYDTHVMDRKDISKKSFKAKLYRFCDLGLLKANKVFFLNQSEADYYINLVQNSKHFSVNSSIIPLCIDMRKEAKLNFFNSNQTKTLNICWWGTFIPLHGLDKIIDAALILKDRNIHFQLHLFGDSVDNAKPFQKMIEKLDLNSNVFIYDEYSFSKGNLELFLVNNCDLALGAFGDSVKAKIVITNKVLDALSMKIPVITCYSLGIEEYFKNNLDLFLCQNTPQNIALKILEISNKSTNEIERIVISGHKKFMADFSFDAFKTRILQEMKEI